MPPLSFHAIYSSGTFKGHDTRVGKQRGRRLHFDTGTITNASWRRGDRKGKPAAERGNPNLKGSEVRKWRQSVPKLACGSSARTGPRARIRKGAEAHVGLHQQLDCAKRAPSRERGA